MDAVASPRPLINLRQAGARRAGRWLVRGVDLAVHKGEIVTLIGPNGSGKSTTAKMALGLIAPDEGRVDAPSGVVIGYVPQKLSIDWTLPLTVSRFMTLTRPLKSREIHEALEMVGMGGSPHAEVRRLSGGEFQRVMLARAIARKPGLLVLDEPVQGVDFAGEIALYDLIADIRGRLGCGVLMISHDLHVVVAAADQVLCLNGRVCCRGTPSAVSETPIYRELFGSRAAGALAVYEHDHGHDRLRGDRARRADGSITGRRHPDDGHRHDHGGGDRHGGDTARA